jgi:hypothetical protein
MSIWSTVGLDGPQVVGIPDETNAARYRGEGEATAVVDVAVTGHHDRTRLGIEFDGSTKDVLLDRENVARLRDRLTSVLEGGS